MMNPLVSVVMPAYNAEKYIVQSVESVLAQSFSDFELIIIDDCSTDDTYRLVKEFSDKDLRIKAIKVEKNSGVANARNRGISLSRGSWIAFIDSDDLWLPQKLEHQLKMVCENDADLIYCSYSMVDESGTRVCNDFIVPERIDFESLILENVIGCSTVVVKSNIFKKYSFLSHVYHEDYALWLDILNAGYKAIGDKSIMVQYCVRGDSRSSGKIKCAYYRWKIYRNHLNLPFFKSVRALFGYAAAGFKKYKKN